MNKVEIVDRIIDGLVTIIAIAGIVYLGMHGEVNIEILTAIAGLGGYRLYQNRKFRNRQEVE